MSNRDDDAEEAADEPAEETAEDAAAETAEDAADLSVEDLESRLDDAEAALEDAETEADLDAVEATLDDVESDLDAADLPEPDEPDEDAEDAEDPREALEDRLSDLREDLEAQRGPYVEDVVEVVDDARSTVEAGEWTEDGEDEVAAAVETFLDALAAEIDVAIDAGSDVEENAAALGEASEALSETALDPDQDEETIAALLAAAETLSDDLEAAEEWTDLTMRERLVAEGYYDVLEPKNRKDFPPEWAAAKVYAKEGEAEPILSALEKFGDADFMEEYFLMLLKHMGADAQPAFEEMHRRAQKRNKLPIEILGKIGDERACETLHDFIDGDGDHELQKKTMLALGQIGSEDSTQPVANRLAADDPEIRSTAARALGLIGDTRAIEPLADVLDEDEADEVRASAAWALNQIGTQRALDVLAEYGDDRSYLVQTEAEKAAGT